MQEIITERRENSKISNLGGNKRGLDVSIGAIHYKDNYGSKSEEWKDIDTTIVGGKVRKAPYELDIDTANKSIHVKDKKTGGELTLTLNNVKDLLGSVIPSAKVKAITKGNRVTWKNVYTDTDIEIEALATQIKFKRILKSELAPTEAEFDIQEKGKGIELVCKAAERGEIFPLQLDVERTKNKLIERIDIQGKKFPVVVDPTLDLQVGASLDDASAAYTIPWLTNSANWVVLCDTTWDYRTYLRFASVTIPNGATIDVAYLSFKCTNDAVNAGGALTLHGFLETDVGDFPNWATANGYAITTASTPWTPGAWSVETWYNSPSLVDEVKEIVDQVGWASNNHLGFRTQNSDNALVRCAWSHDQGATVCAKFHVEYSTGWANIGKVLGATATDLAKVNSVAVGDIAKLNGAAV